MSCTVAWDEIEKFVFEVFTAYGVPEADAKICTDVLLEADRRGVTSHGVNRLKPFYLDRIEQGIQSAVTNVEVVRETPTTAVLDCHNGMGQVAAHRAMNMAIEKGKAYGLAMTVVRGSTHYGIAGYYATMASSAGLIGITGTNARPAIAPTFGTENKLGTNPLTFAMPTDEPFPFLLDCATSTIQRGNVEHWARLGKETPSGMIIDENGTPLTDSAYILDALLESRAAFTPVGGSGDELGGHKGYGYATVVEILSAALQSANFLSLLTGKRDGKSVPYGLGHFFIVIDPEAFLGLDAFKKTAGDILRELRASRRQPGCERIYTAGEKEHLCWQRIKDTGVEINDSVRGELVEVRDKAKLPYRFPFERRT